MTRGDGHAQPTTSRTHSPPPGGGRDRAPRLLWAPQAWIDGRWRDAAVLETGSDGCWRSITTGQPPPADAAVLDGPVLPGLVDAHSHAFQRAFAGLTEQRAAGRDDFWSWRDRMYGVALNVTPAELRRWAARLYSELLLGGYTQVCEFHYLHHDRDGQPYADPLTMCTALADAADDAGIGLTLLPALYERAGFAQPALRDDQRRFAADPARVIALRDGVRALGRPRLRAGVAIHSLRAASAEAIDRLVDAVADDGAPIHVHVAEQTGEVDDCLAATGARPIEWLLRRHRPDARWHLVHATHALPGEIDAVARSGAGVVLCPGTEANLGDGLTDVPHWLSSGTPLSIGSDSHVTRAWPEELRWLEYGQRLKLRQRNVCADPAVAGGSTAQRLFERALHAGAAAAGFAHWGLRAGARADLLVVDAGDSALDELPAGALLDALVFSSPTRPFAGVLVAGRWAVEPAPRGASGGDAARR